MPKEFEWTTTPHDCGRREIFVPGHVRSDGVYVRPYCRSRGKEALQKMRHRRERIRGE